MSQTPCLFKTCPDCDKTMPVESFYKFSHGPYYTRRCKDCHKIAQVVRYRNKVEDPNWLESERARGRKRKLAAIARGKVAQIDSAKRKAHYAVGNAIRDGKLVKPTACEECGSSVPSRRLHAHHADYSKPLDVEFLCSRCHGIRHRKYSEDVVYVASN